MPRGRPSRADLTPHDVWEAASTRVRAEPSARIQTPKPGAQWKSPFPAQLCRPGAQSGQLERAETLEELPSQAHVLPDRSLIQQAEKRAVAWETPWPAAAAPQYLPAEKPGAQADAQETWAPELEWASTQQPAA